MSTREEFGKYLLLKKLAEDPLGETFRAGRLGAQGMEQVVLLRVYNGQGLDTTRLATGLEERKEVQTALKSPNIGSGVDVGRVRGVPYAAYDYISGKALSTLSTQAQREGSPFPVDHALLIADRIGLALTAAFEARHGGGRVQHGMVVPHLVMVSNEGETRLLGFEAGPALAAQARTLAPEIQRYVAPEIRAGGVPGKSSDVFSLGVILFELLTGKALPTIPGAGYDSLVQQARLAAENKPMPPEIAALLARSLAPPDSRIPDPPSWHKALAKVMADHGFNATTFNLAFFMHNLFREEIERESREIEAEKTIDVPARATSVVPDGAQTMKIPQDEVRRAAAGGAVVGAAGTDDTSTVMERYDDVEAKGSGSKKGLLIALAAVLVIAAIAAGVYFAMLRSDAQKDEAEQAAATEVPEPAVTEPAEPAGPTPEEIQAQIDSMFDEKAKAMEETLKSEYDDRIAQMQRQLEEAQSAAAERTKRLEEERARREAEAEKQAALETEEVEQPASGAVTGANNQKTAAATKTAPAPQPVEPAPQPAPEPAPQPAAPQVKRGELVTPGPGVISPRLTRRATPTFPPLAARLNKEATVEVRVLVSETGEVLEAEIQGRKPGYGFDEEALKAARGSTFQPATKFEVPVKMWTSMRFAFKR